VPHADPLAEGSRILTICNACRYCEGYCAVFPAMEHRQEFAAQDLYYLANLCHNCAECYYACQYAPPHEFAVNVPQVLAAIRRDSYRHYAWPQFLAGLFERSGRLALGILALTLGLEGFLALAFAVLFGMGLRLSAANTFYQVIPHAVMVIIFGTVSGLVLAALAASVRQVAGLPGKVTWPVLKRAARSILTLEYLASGGAGCTYPDARHSMARRWLHHCTFYGFLLCFASTTVAAFYHYALARLAPYPYFSLPVVLGTLGGAGLLVGPAGLYWLKRRRDPAIVDPGQDGLDLTFLTLLFATSFTGLLLLALRQSHWMGVLLVIHLATVLALFATIPYGKFVHGIYRAAALWRYAAESSERTGASGYSVRSPKDSS
jgi:citrate/tricarballylate utilization protein